MKNRRRPLGPGLAILLALVAVATPASAHAQEEAKLTRERLTEFAKAHIEIAAARDDFHGVIARVHDEEGRARAREEVEAKITAILEAHGISREEYDDITLRISMDGDLRAMFDEIMTELEGSG